jgi:hypothetical protein
LFNFRLRLCGFTQIRSFYSQDATPSEMNLCQ